MYKIMVLSVGITCCNIAVAQPNCWELGLEQIEIAEAVSTQSAARQEAFQKAQDYFICAAEKRVSEAAYRAAALSDKGLARKLDKETIERYYRAGSLGGNKDSSLAMASLVCGGDTQKCAAPMEAKKWLIKATRQGSADAAQLLAVQYEKGDGEPADKKRAAACYKLAEERGNSWARQNYLRLNPGEQPIDTAECTGNS
jgi:TPR repeat protein